MKIFKIILIATLGISILLLIPDLMLPLTALIDSVLTTELTTALNNAYDSIPIEFMNLLVMHFSSLVVAIIIGIVLND